MNGLPYFAFYANDFVGGVKLFTTEEVGAYVLLLCYQWTNGPLPKDQPDLDRIACATVSQRVRNKFQDTPEGLINERLEVERARGMTKKQNALARLHKHRKSKPSETRFNGVAKPVAQRFRSDSDSLLPLGNRTASGKAKKKGIQYGEEFTAFYAAYPRKVGKDDAQRAWDKAAHKPPLAIILAKLEEFKTSRDWTKDNGAFIPYPATWLNQGRWADELPKPKPTEPDFF